MSGFPAAATTLRLRGRRFRILVAECNLADPNVLFPSRRALPKHSLHCCVLTTSGLFRGLKSEYCGSFSYDFSQNDDILCRKKVMSRSEEITSAGAVAFITHKPVMSCTNTGRSAPVLLRLLGHLCLDRLGTVWPRAPASPGKTAAMRKWGTRARRSASAVGNDLTVEGFGPASTSNTPGSTREEASGSGDDPRGWI